MRLSSIRLDYGLNIVDKVLSFIQTPLSKYKLEVSLCTRGVVPLSHFGQECLLYGKLGYTYVLYCTVQPFCTTVGYYLMFSVIPTQFKK
jgi:hypothetical protein